MKRKLTSLGATSALVLVLSAEGACKSDDESPPPPPPPCTMPAGTTDDFCLATAAYDGRCGHCSDCVGKNREKCTERGSSISAAYRAAFIACKESMPCETGFSALGCVTEKMKTATPTAAQQEAKTKYCSSCAATDQNKAACDDFFKVDAAKNGAGFNILLAGDATAAKAGTNCAAKCDPFEYGVCVALTQCADSGGDYCQDGGFCGVR